MEPIHKPPKWANRFINWFCRRDYLEDITGDLEEYFQIKTQEIGIRKANWWYSIQVLLLFNPRFIKLFNSSSNSFIRNTMLLNYLKIGFRNIRKHKSTSAINIVGLSLGMASFILIALFIRDEMSYDKHFKDVDQIYRVTVKNYDQSGQISRQWAFASAGHAERLKADYPSVEYATRFYAWAFPDLRYADKFLPGERVVFADNDVFDIFSFEFLLGNPANAFEKPNSLVLTESSAIKIFGNDWQSQDILSQDVMLSRGDEKAPFRITAVIADMPEQQHFHFEYLAPIRFVENLFGEEEINNVGGNYNWLTYVKLSDQADARVLANDVNAEFWDKYIGNFPSGAIASDYYDFEFQPIGDIHLHSNLEGEIETNGSIQQVNIFGVIGILLLLIAIVNYMNLATSHYSKRMKEVGVRKAIGAYKSSLIKQFLTESTIITGLSLPVSVLFVFMALPLLNEFADKNLVFSFFRDFELFAGLMFLLILVGVLAGIYPALFLSRINTVNALKGEQSVRVNKWNFRSILVTFQYSVVIALIFSLTVIEGQLNFIRITNPGYQKEHLISLGLTNNIENLDVFRQELLNNPSITQVSFASRVPTGRLLDSWGAQFYQGDSLAPLSFRLPSIHIDENYIDAFEIPIVAGQNFTPQQSMVKDSTGYYLINRTAAKALGFEDPRDAVGKQLAYGPFDGKTYGLGRILGVTEDFHFESLHSQITPLVMMKLGTNYRLAVIKIRPEDINNTLTKIESTFRNFDPVNSPNYRFVDELFEQQYQQEERLSTVIKVFTGIAIIIGCLGLIGMVGFIINTRMKEIGIRKVLGASLANILQLIGQRFLILLTIAFVCVLPLAYWLLIGWLEDFVYRTNISFFMIIMPLIGAIVLTLIATIYQTLKAAVINPVKYLKNE